MADISLKGGQQAIFYSGELPRAEGNELKANYTAYGAEVQLTASPAITVINQNGYTAADTLLNYTILPPEYNAVTADIDIIKNSSWERYLPGSKTQGTDSAAIVAGSAFEVDAVYTAQAVLNRGSDNEIRGDFVPLLGYNADLDIDSDNNSPETPDGLQSDPGRDWGEEYLEDVEGRPGKVIRANTGDKDRDGVPDYADGMNLFNNADMNTSPSFTPLLLQIKMSGSGGKAKFRLVYPESDPAAISKTGDDTAGYTYAPAPGEPGKGSIRIWASAVSRQVAPFGQGGDYIKSGEAYSLEQMGMTSNPVLRLYAEGITSSSLAGDVRVQLQIDPDGDGPMPFVDADAVRFTVHDSALVPDYDRNRSIDNQDRKRAQAGDPFYFWINDDDDEGETEGTDIPGAKKKDTEGSHVNYETIQVDGIRDLIDFFPLYLDIKHLVNLFSPAEYKYLLVSENESLNFVYSYFTAPRSGDYLTGGTDSLEPAPTLGKTFTYTIGPNGIRLDPEYLEQIKLDAIKREGIGVILLEGRKASTKPLELKIYDNKGTLVTSLKLNLSLDGVEQMFRHKNLTSVAYKDLAPGRGSKAGELDRLNEPKNCPDVECTGISSINGKSFIYVHGYGNNGQEARGRQVEIFKRMFWSGSKAKFYGVTWYGWDSQLAGVTPNFHINVQHAFATVPALKNFIYNDVAGEVTIAAHSLGNMVVSAMLTDNAEGWDNSGMIKSFFMMDAAVAAEAYGAEDDINYPPLIEAGTHPDMTHPSWKGYDKKLWASEWHLLFDDADNRKKLTWRNIFKNRPASVAYYNFYSSGEEVLDMHKNEPNILDIGIFKQTGRYAWALQEKLKGDLTFNTVLGSNYGGWGFNEIDYYAEVDAAEYGRIRVRMPAVQANNIEPYILKATPFFLKGNETTLFDELGGSNYAAKHKIRLLADAIPARTLAAGKNEVLILGDIDKFNFNMQTTYKTKKRVNGQDVIFWPSSRGNEDNWRHGDAREAAYSYVYTLFDKFVEILDVGGLK